MVSVSCTPKPFCCGNGFCELHSKTLTIGKKLSNIIFRSNIKNYQKIHEVHQEQHEQYIPAIHFLSFHYKSIKHFSSKQSSESQHTTNFEFFSSINFLVSELNT
jgi:hypothetical protein